MHADNTNQVCLRSAAAVGSRSAWKLRWVANRWDCGASGVVRGARLVLLKKRTQHQRGRRRAPGAYSSRNCWMWRWQALGSSDGRRFVCRKIVIDAIHGRSLVCARVHCKVDLLAPSRAIRHFFPRLKIKSIEIALASPVSQSSKYSDCSERSLLNTRTKLPSHLASIIPAALGSESGISIVPQLRH
jgi:hypothetical protein